MTKLLPDQRIAALAARQYGVFSRKQAQAVGAGKNVIDHRVASGRWERAAYGVYRVSGMAGSWRQSLMISCLAWGAGATISHRAAGRLRRLTGLEQELVELTVPRHRRGAGPGTVHRNKLLEIDVEIIDGIPVTTTARTLIDLASV